MMALRPRPDRVIVGVSIVAVSLGFACLVPAEGQPEFIDQRLFRLCLEFMRGGMGYYPAMNRALHEVYGPAESVRAFRMPTLFLAWAHFPSVSWIWLAYTAFVGLCGLAMLALAESPILALVAVLYLLCNADLREGDHWLLQYTTTELWAAPLAALTMVAWQRRRSGPAAGLALLTTLVRETAAGLIVGGLIAAYRAGRPLRPWLVALGLALIAYLAHAGLVRPYLAPPGQGRETALVQEGRGLLGCLRMTGFGLPAGVVVGPILWGFALYRVTRRDRAGWMAIPYLMLPLTGLLVHRSYWGLMIVPLTVIWGGDAIRDAASGIRRASGRRRAAPMPDGLDRTDARHDPLTVSRPETPLRMSR